MSAAPIPSDARLAELLQQTSRTFALAIPLLAEPSRRAVELAYLAFRVADTLEDAAAWTQRARLEALDELALLLRPGQSEASRAAASRWAAALPSEHAGYLALLRELPGLLSAIDALAPPIRALVYDHAARTTRGMAQIQRDSGDGGRIALRTLAALQHYCYVVAGIVGELLTELFLLEAPQLSDAAAALRANQLQFGEALQLVNVLKDQQVDLEEGRSLIPAAVPRAQVLALARGDLLQARRYVETLREALAPAGMVAFTQLPLELAELALRELELRGPGAKVPRPAVEAAFARALALLQPA